jgi:hypothetical protein
VASLHDASGHKGRGYTELQIGRYFPTTPRRPPETSAATLASTRGSTRPPG